jgi:hypothetical protein
VASGAGGSIVRSSGGLICTCSEWEVCPHDTLDRAQTQTVRSETGTSKTLGQDDIGHPQLADSFWHSFGQSAKDFALRLQGGA